MEIFKSKISSNMHKFMFLPATLLFALFFVLPLIQGVGVSMTDWN